MQNKVDEIKISYRAGTKASKWQKVSCSKDVAKLLFEHWDKDSIGVYECFKVMLLNNASHVKGIFTVSQGGIASTLVDVRLLFAVVLKSLSVSIILTHNHPSGTLKPSEQDKSLTQKIKSAAKLFDISVLDHIILSPNGSYFSFADEGIL